MSKKRFLLLYFLAAGAIINCSPIVIVLDNFAQQEITTVMAKEAWKSVCVPFS